MERHIKWVIPLFAFLSAVDLGLTLAFLYCPSLGVTETNGLLNLLSPAGWIAFRVIWTAGACLFLWLLVHRKPIGYNFLAKAVSVVLIGFYSAIIIYNLVWLAIT
jgi:hypothetical protein